tara:strand:- start:1319 stop:2032 length:714 start_codon:yes stop_codon:yes gene_type:complete
MEKAKKIKIILGIIYLLILFIFLWSFFSIFSIDEISSYEFIKKNRQLLLDFKDNNFLLITFMFLIMCIAWVFLLGFGVPPALLAGFIFGKWFGTLIISFSLTVGATCLYFFANFFLKDFIREKFEKRFGKMIGNFKKNEFLYFFIYRFVGGIPFAIANVLPTLFNIKLKNYFFGSLFGMTPGLFIVASLGSGLEKIIDENLVRPSFFDMIQSPEIFIPIISFLFLFVITFIIRKKLN